MRRVLPRDAAHEPRAVCFRCARPRSVCICSAVVRVETRTRVVILQHPRERRVPVGTARIAELALANAVRHVGVDFSADPAVRAALSDPEAPPILLYPGPRAHSLSASPPDGPVTLVVLDGTWWQAAKLLKTNPLLAALPRYAIEPAQPSRYRIRREPAEHCVSTIEAIVSALGLLEAPGSDVTPALAPFDRMVETQLDFAQRGEARHVHRRLAVRPHPLEWLAARRADLVVAYGEANAWPKTTALGRTPEIVHWAAERLFTAERFEARIRPRHALSPSFEAHTRLPKELVKDGEPRDVCYRRWAEFLRPTDLLCSWGHFAPALLGADGALMPERVDIRALARRELGRKLGDVAECAQSLGAPPEPSGVPGRTGARLDGLAAVVRALVDRAPARESRK